MSVKLSQYKLIIVFVFWTALILYLLLKNFFSNVPDLLLNILIIFCLLTQVIVYLIKSIISYRSDSEFYRKPLWISTIYFAGSVSIFVFFFEIIEVIPKIIRTNLYISIVVFLVAYYLSRVQIQK